MNSKKTFITIAYVFLLGLIPLLWFKGNLITGTDVNFSPFPSERLQQRLYTWEYIVQTGVPKAHNILTLPYIATSGILAQINSDVVTVEKLTFVIWFSLSGLSMLYLAEKVFYDLKPDERFTIRIFCVLVYMVNFYNMFQWVRLHLTITTLVFLPVLFGVMYTIFERNILTKKDLLLLSIAAILGSSVGTQPPIIYAAIMALASMMLFYVTLYLKRPFEIIPRIKKTILATLIVIAAGAYWIFPQAHFIFTSSLTNTEFGVEVFDVRKLLGWTSETTNFLNILRNYGDVVWLDKWGGQEYFPEFVEFYNSEIFAFLSMVVLFVVFLPFYLDQKKRRTISLFGIMLIPMLFFSKGLHPPFEIVFELAFEHLPAFWIHRAPWQKFGAVTSVLYAILAGYGLFLVVSRIERRVKVKNIRLIASLFFAACYLFYHHLFVLGQMFPTKDSDVGYHGHYNLGFHIEFPKYMYETKDYMNKVEKENKFNIFLLPELKTSVYDWGYGGSTDIVSIFLERPTLYSLYGEGYYLDGFISNVYNDMVHLIYDGNVSDLTKVANFFGVKYILQRNDFEYGFYGDTDSPEFIANAMENLGFNEKTSFGKWDLYKIGTKSTYPDVGSGNYIIDVSGLRSNMLLPILNTNEPGILLFDEFSKNKIRLENDPRFNEIYVSAVRLDKDENCTDCGENTNCETICYELVIKKAGAYDLSVFEPDYTKIDLKYFDTFVTDSNGMEIKELGSTDNNTYNLEEGKYSITLSRNEIYEFAEYPEISIIEKEEFIEMLGSSTSKITDVADLIKTIENQGNSSVIKNSFREPDSLSQYFFSAKNILDSNVIVIQTVDFGGNSEISGVIAQKEQEKGQLDDLNIEFGITSGVKHLNIYEIGFPKDNFAMELLNNQRKVAITKKVYPNLIFNSSYDIENPQPPVLTYRVENPTKLEAEIVKTEASEAKAQLPDFNIILNQTYSPYWELFIITDGTKTKVPQNRHFLSNFYGNGWQIKSSDYEEESVFTFEFQLQKSFYLGAVISTATLTLLMGNILYTKLHERRVENPFNNKKK